MSIAPMNTNSSMHFSRGSLFARGFAALPDAITASIYLVTWFVPEAFGSSTVKMLMLLMLVEFIMVHSGGFLGGLLLDETKSKASKSLALLGMSAFYFIFIAAFALAFESWWPVYTFAWLIGAKLIGIYFSDRDSQHAKQWQMRVWGFSVVAYLGALFSTTLLWVPKFGITSDVIPSLGLKGSGLWVDQPQTVIVAGLIYFGLLAWFKWTQPSWALKRQT